METDTLRKVSQVVSGEQSPSIGYCLILRTRWRASFPQGTFWPLRSSIK